MPQPKCLEAHFLTVTPKCKVNEAVMQARPVAWHVTRKPMILVVAQNSLELERQHGGSCVTDF